MSGLSTETGWSAQLLHFQFSTQGGHAIGVTASSSRATRLPAGAEKQMQYSKGTMAVESDHDSIAQSANTLYRPPWELDEIRHHALGRMLAGLCLSLLGIVLGLVSPTVAAQTDYAAPDVVQLGAIGVVAMTLVLVLLALLRKNGQRATNRQHNGHNLSVHERSSASGASGFEPLSEPDILRQVAEQFEPLP